MDNTQEKLSQEEQLNQQDEGYVERPKWQVWGARVALVIFLLFVVLQLLQIAGGGL